VFSDGSPEGRIKDIDGEFPSDSHPYTEDYDYPSDSDLEDEPFYSEEEDAGGPESYDPEMPPSPQDPDSRVPSATPLEHPPHPQSDVNEVRNQ